VIIQAPAPAAEVAEIANLQSRAATLLRASSDYVSLTKPRIAVLLLITELGSMVAAARGWPGARLVGLALLGGALSAGGASAVNCWFDRDIDARMDRTCTRALPAGRIAPARALGFGITLAAAGFMLLALATNWLAAWLALAGGAFYVIVYTMWLKRSTPQNIVIGGAAGAFPPLVGWAAVTGRIEPAALALFAVILAWTPPHFWSLALLLQRQYREVRVPMLPVVAGAAVTRRAVLRYSLLLAGVSLAPGVWLGPAYLWSAVALGVPFLVLAELGRRYDDRRWAVRLFHYSLVYLAALFAAVGVAGALK
jgi:protoheme IX farnesyltransferase